MASNNLAGEVQGRILDSARDFFGESIGVLKGRLENDRSQLQNLLDHLPESQEATRSQLQKLVGSYEDVQYILDRVTQKQEVEDTVERVVQEAQEEKEDGQQVR
jgi:hypothetical protein